MASNTYGAIKLSTAEDVGVVLKKKTGSQDGYKPKEWADTINLMGLLPVRTASGSIAHFTDGADAVPLKSLTAQILPIQSGTGTPSPSNPRPISGTDELTLTQQGANLFDYSNLQTGYRVVWGTGADYADASASKSDYILVKEGARLRFTASVYVLGYDTEKTYLGAYIDSAQSWLKQSGSLVDDVTIPKGTAYIKIMDFGSISGTITSAFVVNYGETKSTDTTYHTAETYTFDLGQEIMGGSADVVGGSGEVTRVVVTYDGTEDWHSEGTNNFYVDSGRGSGVYYGEDKLLCSHFKSTYSSLGHNNNVYISATGNLNLQCDDITHTADGIKTWCATQYANGTPLQICYELKTSTEYTFTGQPIDSYLGVNNLYVDSGEVLDVEYRADIDLLIAELEG